MHVNILMTFLCSLPLVVGRQVLLSSSPPCDICKQLSCKIYLTNTFSLAKMMIMSKDADVAAADDDDDDLSMQGMMKKMPGPLAPPRRNRPSLVHHIHHHQHHHHHFHPHLCHHQHHQQHFHCAHSPHCELTIMFAFPEFSSSLLSSSLSPSPSPSSRSSCLQIT